MENSSVWCVVGYICVIFVMLLKKFMLSIWLVLLSISVFSVLSFRLL